MRARARPRKEKRGKRRRSPRRLPRVAPACPLPSPTHRRSRFSSTPSSGWSAWPGAGAPGADANGTAGRPRGIAADGAGRPPPPTANASSARACALAPGAASGVPGVAIKWLAMVCECIWGSRCRVVGRAAPPEKKKLTWPLSTIHLSPSLPPPTPHQPACLLCCAPVCLSVLQGRGAGSARSFSLSSSHTHRACPRP